MSDALRAEMTQLTSDLVAFASTADRPDQIHGAIDYIAAYVEKIPGVYWQRVEQNGVPSLVATLRETRTPKIFLNGHIDVVAAKEEQFTTQERDGKLYGRATQDMKGSVASMLRLLKDLAAVDNPPDVGFQFVGDEEIGGYDSTGFLLESGWTCDFFIATEPTDLAICYAQKGVAWYEVELKGVAAHGSRPWEGVNPVLALGHGLAELDKRNPVPAPDSWVTTIVPTILHSSSQSRNQVPPGVKMSVDVRYIPEDSTDRVTELLHTCFPDAEIILQRPGPPLDTDPNDPFVQKLAKITSEVIGKETRLYREHFASDARFYSSAGIPAVCFGPVGAGLHSDNEWVDPASLVQLYDVLRRFVS